MKLLVLGGTKFLGRAIVEAAEGRGHELELCEEEVRGVYSERALLVRPGLIVGPHDPTDRFTYWPRRVERGGPILTGKAGPTAEREAGLLAEWEKRAA